MTTKTENPPAEVEKAKPPTRLGQLHDLLMSRSDEIQRVLPETMSAERLIKVGLIAMTQNPDLMGCSTESIMLALMESGQCGLEPNGTLGEAALIPYRGTAQFQPMVRGLIKLAKRSGEITKLEARNVHEGDSFQYEYGLTPRLTHVPNLNPAERGEITHTYAIAWPRVGEPLFEVMSVAEVEKTRSVAAAKNSPAWTKFYGEMCRKTVVKRLSKYLDLSSEVQAVFLKDSMVEIGEDVPLSAIAPGQYAGPSYDVLAEEQTAKRIEQLRAAVELGDELHDIADDGSFVPFWDVKGMPGGYALWAVGPGAFIPCKTDDISEEGPVGQLSETTVERVDAIELIRQDVSGEEPQDDEAEEATEE